MIKKLLTAIACRTIPDMKEDLNLPLFNNYRSTDPQTSKEAAEKSREFSRGQCIKIIDCLKSHGSMGKTLIAEFSGIGDVAVARRLADLQKAGLAEPTKATQLSASGRNERVWRLTVAN